MRVNGDSGAKPIECIHPRKDKWVARWDFQDEESGVSYEERVFDHKPTAGEIEAAKLERVAEIRAEIVARIEAHDKSAAVNSFTVGRQSMWLNREERTSLARTIAISEAAGAAEFSMWAGGSPPVRFDIPIAMASGMLDELERYAAATYNVTQSHIAAVYTLASVAELETYDFTAGYPPKLELNL